ncbi:hypothetical protein C0214_27780 (plasmid) [Methylobacterium sp. DM1]|nr:hypothetical protein C0214_27780 [Methylobacterium sp. DM1]
MSDELGPLGSTPIRWPTPGDKLFTSGGPDDAILRPTFGTSMHMMEEGYLRAADALVEKATTWSYERDTLVWPIVFLYRQYLELVLKGSIAEFGRDAGVEANWKSHDLAFLWSEFKKIMHHWDIQDEDKANTTVGKVIAEFSRIDPSSMSFRYPITHAGEPIELSGHERLDLLRLKDVMRGVANFMTGTTEWMAEMIKCGPDDEPDDGPGYDGPDW